MRKDDRVTYQNKTFKSEKLAQTEIEKFLISGHIVQRMWPRIEYVGGKEPYIITIVETNRFGRQP